MPTAKPKFMPDPHYWTDIQVAAYLGVSVSWLAGNRARLEAEGLPKPDQGFGGKTHSEALERWYRRRGGLIDGDSGGGEDSDRALQRVGAVHGAARVQ